MNASASSAIKLGVAILLLAGSVVCFIKFSPAGESGEGRAYFYDLEEQKLFVAPSSSIPPTKGIKGAAMAGVRAVVISPTGDPGDKKHREIAYLERYSPEIKRLFEEVRQARAEGRSEEGRIDRKQVPGNTWVRRLKDTEWHALNSAEGKQIVNEWNAPGADGRTPVVCSP
jgi:hypothetical protein